MYDKQKSSVPKKKKIQITLVYRVFYLKILNNIMQLHIQNSNLIPQKNDHVKFWKFVLKPFFCVQAYAGPKILGNSKYFKPRWKRKTHILGDVSLNSRFLSEMDVKIAKIVSMKIASLSKKTPKLLELTQNIIKTDWRVTKIRLKND